MSGALLFGAILADDATGLSVTVSPPLASGTGGAGGVVPSVTALATGAAGPFTYSWTVIDPPSGGGSLAILAASSATTGFDFSFAPIGETTTATVRVTATDGTLTGHCDVTVQYYRSS